MSQMIMYPIKLTFPVWINPETLEHYTLDRKKLLPEGTSQYQRYFKEGDALSQEELDYIVEKLFRVETHFNALSRHIKELGEQLQNGDNYTRRGLLP